MLIGPWRTRVEDARVRPTVSSTGQLPQRSVRHHPGTNKHGTTSDSSIQPHHRDHRIGGPDEMTTTNPAYSTSVSQLAVPCYLIQLELLPRWLR